MTLPPPGPSNIIVRSPWPCPAPKTVGEQGALIRNMMAVMREERLTIPELSEWEGIRCRSPWREPEAPPVGDVDDYDLLRDLVLIGGGWYSRVAVMMAGEAGIRPILTSEATIEAMAIETDGMVVKP